MHAGAAAGRGQQEEESRRKSLAFEDKDAWLDDDDTAPGVIA
jgi:hypothetical protein